MADLSKHTTQARPNDSHRHTKGAPSRSCAFMFENHSLSKSFPKPLWPLLLMTVLMLAASACGTVISCAAGDFTAGDTATVVCYFPDDIVNHAGVNIQQFPFSAPNGSTGRDVLVCTAEGVTTSRCRGEDGYELKRHSRNTLVVEIINVTQQAAGQYMCQFIPHDDSPRDRCNLTVQKRVTPLPVNNPHTTTVRPKQSLTTGETQAGSVGIIVGFAWGVLLFPAIFITVAVVFMYRREQLRKRHCIGSVRTTHDQEMKRPGKVRDESESIAMIYSKRNGKDVTQADDGEEDDTFSYLRRMHEIAERLETRLGRGENLSSCCSSDEVRPTSNLLLTCEDALRRLLQEAHVRETEPKRDAEVQTDCFRPLLPTLHDNVECAHVDEHSYD